VLLIEGLLLEALTGACSSLQRQQQRNKIREPVTSVLATTHMRVYGSDRVMLM
jgi:hypothetical protein